MKITLKEIQKILQNFLGKDLKRKMNNKECYFKNCKCKPIGSHSIQKKTLENSIGKNGVVYGLSMENIARNLTKGEIKGIEKISVSKAGVFNGFCGGDSNSKNHDTILFRKIEIEECVQSTSIIDYVFLYAYRALVYQLWVEETLSKPIQKETKNKIENNPHIEEQTVNIIDFQLRNSSTISSDTQISNYREFKNSFETYITEQGDLIGNIEETFNIKYVEIPGVINFAGIGVVNFSSKFPILVGCIPQQFNKPNLFFIVSQKEEIIYDVLLECLKLSPIHTIENLIALTGNMFLSEELYNRLSEENKIQALNDFITPDFGKTYTQYDIVSYHDFCLLNPDNFEIKR